MHELSGTHLSQFLKDFLPTLPNVYVTFPFDDNAPEVALYKLRNGFLFTECNAAIFIFAFLFYSIFLFYPITLEGRRGTTDEFATIPFHLVLFSAALVELAKSIPVHSLILSTHLFFCLPLFLFPSLCPVGLSLLNQKILRHGQTILAFVS